MRNPAAVKFWKNRRVLVAGGSGFIGVNLVRRLLDLGARVTIADRRPHGPAWMKRSLILSGAVRRPEIVYGDLLRPAFCARAARGQSAVFNLAALVPALGCGISGHGHVFRGNVLIAKNLLEACRAARVGRYVAASSAAVYPPGAKVPLRECDGGAGEPLPGGAGYSWAKRMEELLAAGYHRWSPMKIGLARLANVYGPGDHFDPRAGRVIPALISRVMSGIRPIKVFGNGVQVRSFIYVDDAVDGLLALARLHCEADPVNIAGSERTRIRGLLRIILEESGNPRAQVFWDRTRSAGVPRSYSDVSRARKLLGFTARVPLREGIRRTIAWAAHG